MSIYDQFQNCTYAIFNKQEIRIFHLSIVTLVAYKADTHIVGCLIDLPSFLPSGISLADYLKLTIILKINMRW